MPVAVKGTGGGSVTLTAGAAATDTTLTLPNTTGTVALTASPTFSGTVTATTVTSPASTALTVQSAGTTAMTVDTSQNVGIGTASPGYKLDVRGTAISLNTVAGNGGVQLVSSNNTTNTGYLAFFNSTPARIGFIGYADTTFGLSLATDAGSNVPIRFVTNGAEAARIDTSGNLQLGLTNGSNKFNLLWNSTTLSAIVTKSTNETYNGQAILFQNSSGGTSGYINQQTSSVSYVTSSDYRMKDNVAPLSSGLTTIGELKPVTYNWKIDGAAGEGFIAHELQNVIPHAVTGEKDAVNEDGSIKPQGVDYSKIVVHLVAAIQELSAKNDALEAANAAFEARLAALEAK
jgi:hypothetical protein